MKPQIDWLTIGAISVVAYVVANVLHEAVGHGGMCLLLGGKPTALSTAYFDMDETTVSDFGRRLVAAAGTVVNILAGGASWWAMRLARTSGTPLRYFLWLSMTINLLVGTGYFLFSGVSQIGDWIVVIRGMPHHWLWIALLIVVGLAGYLLSIRLALLELLPLLGRNGPDMLRRAASLTVFPYLVGSIAATIGSVLNPLSPMFVFTSAAANFGGTSGLAWMTQLYKRPRFALPEGEPAAIARSWGWIATAGLVLAANTLFLGPSLTW